MASNLDHPHAVPDRGREVEDVLERPDIEQHGEPPLEISWNLRVEIVDDRCLLVPRDVEGVDAVGTEEAQDRVDPTPRRCDEGFRMARIDRNSRRRERAGELARRHAQLLVSEGAASLE